MGNKKSGLIDPSGDKFGLMMNCAVRYALGRRTYMPGAVVNYLMPLLNRLDSRTLYVIDQDITEAQYFGGYGDPCDEREWMKLLAAVRNELTARGEDLYRDWRAQNGT